MAQKRSQFWDAMKGEGVLALGIDSTTLVENQLNVSSLESFLQSTAWGRHRTISVSYASARVPQAFCAQPMWDRSGCGAFDLLLVFRMSCRLWVLLSHISLTDRCGAGVHDDSHVPECSTFFQHRTCMPLDHSHYELALSSFRVPNHGASRACNILPLGLCEILTNSSWPQPSMENLENAMHSLQARVLCLLKPWTAHLDSELQFISSPRVMIALREAFIAVNYVWANTRQRGFDAARAHERRRARAISFVQQVQAYPHLRNVEVWGLALNV